MRSSPASSIYWDANVILSYLDGDEDRYPVADSLLEDSEKKTIILVTSRISVTEVAYAAHERAGQNLDPAVEAAIANLWLPGSPIRVVDVYRQIAEQARGLIRRGVAHGWTGLRANDAIHLATAMREAVDEFHTYETRLDKYAAITGYMICRPHNPRLRLFSRARPVEPPSSQAATNPAPDTAGPASP